MPDRWTWLMKTFSNKNVQIIVKHGLWHPRNHSVITLKAKLLLTYKEIKIKLADNELEQDFKFYVLVWKWGLRGRT